MKCQCDPRDIDGDAAEYNKDPLRSLSSEHQKVIVAGYQPDSARHRWIMSVRRIHRDEIC